MFPSSTFEVWEMAKFATEFQNSKISKFATELRRKFATELRRKFATELRREVKPYPMSPDFLPIMEDKRQNNLSII